MKKLTFVLSFLLCFSRLYSQEIHAAALIVENEIGKFTFVFANTKENSYIFFNSLLKLYEENTEYYKFSYNETDEHNLALIDYFFKVKDFMINEYNTNQESFEIVAGIREDQLTDHFVISLSVNVPVDDTFENWVSFMYLATSDDEKETLFLLIEK